MTKWKLIGLVVVVAVLACIVAACRTNPTPEVAGLGDVYSSFQNLRVKGQLRSEGMVDMALPTAVGTATPGVLIRSAKVRNPLEVRNSSTTPVFQVNPSGNVAIAGSNTQTGALQINNVLQVAPTPATTATPGLYINNTSVGASSLVIADAGTKVAEVTNAGNWLFGTDGAGVDVTFYSGTAGDNFLWDASEEKLIVTGTNAATALDVADGNVVVNDSLTVTAGTFDVTAGATTLEALSVGVDGTGADVYFYSDTAGDWLFYDQANEALTVIGTNGQDALNVDDGNVDIDDDLDVNGTTNLDAVDIDDAVQIDGTVTVGVDGTGKDVTFYSDTAGDLFLWDESEELLSITGTNAATALNIVDGNLVVTAGNASITGGADTTQLTVKGYAGQDASDFLARFANSANVTQASLSATGVMTLTGALTYSGGLSPLAYGTAGKTLVVGSNTITGTLAVSHGLSTAIAGAGCSMNADPAAAAALCSVTYTGTTVTVKVWKNDFTTAGDVGALVNWWVLGN